jgi:hypothetical protein
MACTLVRGLFASSRWNPQARFLADVDDSQGDTRISFGSNKEEM